MRSLSDYLAKEFAAHGLFVDDHQLLDGRQCLAFTDGTRIEVGPFASDAEIWNAARKAFHMTDETVEAVPTVPPAVEIAAPVALKRSAPATPGDHATSIQDMMQQHVRAIEDIKSASIQTLRISLERQLQALSAAPKKVAEKIDGQTEDFLALMGQFTNDLGV